MWPRQKKPVERSDPQRIERAQERTRAVQRRGEAAAEKLRGRLERNHFAEAVHDLWVSGVKGGRP